MERDLAGVRLAEDAEHFHTPSTRHRGNLTHQTALTDAGWPHHPHHRAMTSDCALQQASNGGHFPPSTHQGRLGTPDCAVSFAHA
jgi:hypothetical protein